MGVEHKCGTENYLSFYSESLSKEFEIWSSMEVITKMFNPYPANVEHMVSS